jgi:hypothetical protein
VGVPWKGPALVDGRPWPIASGDTLWLMPGPHVIEPAPPTQAPLMRVLDFNGDLKMAGVTPQGIEFAYQSTARAMALVEHAPAKLEIDGVEHIPDMAGNVLLLPRGQHLISLSR